MAIDRGDYHYDAAQSWERACRHIALFLAWSIERGLASEMHSTKADEATKNPTQYFISACDTKLWQDDLTDEGNAFARDSYEAYLLAVNAYAEARGIEYVAIEDDEATRTHFFATLDRLLAEWRAAR